MARSKYVSSTASVSGTGQGGPSGSAAAPGTALPLPAAVMPSIPAAGTALYSAGSAASAGGELTAAPLDAPVVTSLNLICSDARPA